MKRPLLLAAIALALCVFYVHAATTSLAQQNQWLLRQLQDVHQLSDQQMQKIRAIFAHSGFIGQGNPAISEHPITHEQCSAKLEQQSVNYANGEFEKICGAKYMAPLYDPARESPQQARACIDQFEFPDIPCAYPVVSVGTGSRRDLLGNGQANVRCA